MNVSDVGLADNAGAADTFSVTGIISGLFEAPAEVTVIDPFSVPADRPDVLIETVRFCGVVPDAGVTCNHGADADTVMLDAVVEVSATTCEGGADAPSW